MINWDESKMTKADYIIVGQISKRACDLANFEDGQYMTINMDITACHITNPLKLQELFEADDSNFMHDICGINRHLDRETGQLKDCFSPRYSA